MRICLYTDTSLPLIGGQELVVDALARQFVALGHSTVVLAPARRAPGSFDPASVPYAVAWHPRYLSTRWFLSWYGRWLTRLQRREPFDVIHGHGIYPAGYVAAACSALRDVPLVVTSHGGDVAPRGLYDRKPQLRDRYRFTLERADAAVAISAFTETAYREICPHIRRVELIPNGVHVSRFTTPVARPASLPPAIQPGRYLLFIGRLDQRKGVDLLLRSFAATIRDHDLHLAIAGQGAERPALEALAAELHLGERVCFVGLAQGDLKTYLLQNGLCTVVPSRVWEAFGLVVLESYAAGRPVIGAQLPGLGELIEPERTGLKVPAESLTDLTDAVRRVAAERALADRWGAEARRVAAEYDWRNIACRHLALFEELARGRRGHRAGRKLSPAA